MSQELKPLDKIYSQRDNFLSRANQELLRAQRYLNFLSFVSIDTKNLHAAGENKSSNPNIEIYRKLKRHIRDSIRQTDIISGFNNGNICILLVETNKEGVSIVKERLDESIKYFLHEVAESALNWRVTMTSGSFPDIDHTPNTFYGKLNKVLSD
ncbi:MAG: diguanylate cyclase [candidate division Zixibacteria bacterium]|nr:diguanylate cyclase [candidate division Zixibacteria bacterium]